MIRAFAPLPRRVNPAVPTTGYDDVKRVALARLFVENIPSIQVDWALYGPKLAQVALTVGRERRRWRLRGGRRRHGAAPRPARGDPPEHPGRRPRAGRARRPLRSPRQVSLRDDGSHRCCRVPQRASARLSASIARRAFEVRFDVPSKCADLLHEGDDRRRPDSVDRVPARSGRSAAYLPHRAGRRRSPRAVRWRRSRCSPRRTIRDVRSIALDTSSRTSVALVRVLCAREFRIRPMLDSSGPRLDEMLAKADAGLLIGDNALFLESDGRTPLNKIDLGEVWTRSTGLPFVYAFWAGRPDVLTGGRRGGTAEGARRRASRVSPRSPPAVSAIRGNRRSGRATCGIISSTTSATTSVRPGAVLHVCGRSGRREERAAAAVLLERARRSWKAGLRPALQTSGRSADLQVRHRPRMT